MFDLANRRDSKVPAVSETITLAQLIQAQVDRGVTYQEMHELSGKRVSPNYIHNLKNGTRDPKKLGVEIIYGLSRALAETPATVLHAALEIPLKDRNSDLHQLVDDYSELPKKDEDALKLLWEALRREVYERRKKAIQQRPE